MENKCISNTCSYRKDTNNFRRFEMNECKNPLVISDPNYCQNHLDEEILSSEKYIIELENSLAIQKEWLNKLKSNI